jgi:multidrug efflux pump subunit AcrB
MKPHEIKNKSHASSYVKKLIYRSSDYFFVLRNYITNMRLVALVLIFLIFGGIVSFITISRTLNPEINIAVVVVTTALPGATPTDVEQLVTKKIEKEIAKVEDVDVITSTSRESISSVVVEFADDVTRDKAQTDVQNAVSSIADLPTNAQKPQVKAVDFEDIPIMRYAVVANGIDDASVNSFIDAFVEELEEQDIIDRVEVSGNQQQEVQILLSQEKLQELNVNIQSLARSISETLASYPSGKVYTDGSEIGLTIDRGSNTVAELRNVVVEVDQVLYRLGDIANVFERSAPGYVPAFLTSTTGIESNAITIDVYRIIGARISEANQRTLQVIEKYEELAGDDITFVSVTNMNDEIESSFSDLYRNLSVTVVLVFCMLFLFVGARQALLAAISVPLVFMTAFIAMMVTGMTLNFLSIFSLLLSLGLLVDVTIVVISAITTYYRSGKFTPKQAALLVWKDFFPTLLITTLTTVWAFLPLLLSTGIIGEFIKPIPIVVTSILVGSVFVGFFIILPLMVWLLDFTMPRRVRIFFRIIFFVIFVIVVQRVFALLDIHVAGALWIVVIPTVVILLVSTFFIIRATWKYILSFFKRHMHSMHSTVGECTQDGIINVSRFAHAYQDLLDVTLKKKAMRRMIVGMVVVFFLFSSSLLFLGFVKNEFFPSSDMTIVYASMELPLDTRADITEDVARDFVSKILTIEGVKNIQTQIGARVSAEGGTVLGLSPNNVLVTINLFDEDEREKTSVEIAQLLRESDAVRMFDAGELTISELDGGPPAGADVTIKFKGDDLDLLNDYANQTIENLQSIAGTLNVKKSVEQGSGKVVFDPDDGQLRAYGVNVSDVGFFLRTLGSGFIVEEDVDFDELAESRDVVIRFSSDVQSLETLERAVMIAQNGQKIPLTTLGDFRYEQSPMQIDREDQKRVLSVTAAVEDGFNAGEINQEIGNYVDQELGLASGYTWESGGANEENQKSIQSILQAMVLALILIFLTLIVQLNSYRKSFIVLLVIPLAISGVFVLFAIFGIPLSFPALIGLLALFGIVINNSIMIIDQINKNHREDLPFHQAVIEGAASRLEPILLSSLTTIVGLLPITITQPLWQGLGGAIIAGLVFSGTIMLFFIPAVYYMMMERDYLTK